MDWSTLVAAVTSSLGLGAGGAYWLGKSLVQHKLSEALEERKSDLARQLDMQKILAAQDLERLKNALQMEQAAIKGALDAEIRKAVETQLGEIAAQRQYEYEARRRLYLAIGPLRFQLLLACRDLVSRIRALGATQNYQLGLDSYYARSTVYRVLKPIALATLIEEQMTLADFSVDKSAIDCLRFRRSVTRIFSGDELAGDHPDVDWSSQTQHVFADSLAAVAQALIERPSGGQPRSLRFDEFNARLGFDGWKNFSPFDRLLEGFKPRGKPILWLRLVAYAHACNALVMLHGQALGFSSEPFDAAPLLARSNDGFTNENLARLLTGFEQLDLVLL